MYSEFQFITQFVLESFARIWPYLLITIPVAVAVQLSGASKYIRQALSARPVIAILLATIVGAFSPFCSCTVIPIIAALLIGGVPLAPVMAFWIASPSMDPEIFFLSVAMVGWEIAVWRLVATLMLSLSAGYITQLAMSQHWLGDQILRDRTNTALVPVASITTKIANGWQKTVQWFWQLLQPARVVATVNGASLPVEHSDSKQLKDGSTGSGKTTLNAQTASDAPSCSSSCSPIPISFRSKLLKETQTATTLVIQFMLMAFILEALIIRYVPAEWITNLLGQQNPFAIVLAAIVGVPVYTSNLSALPMVGGLLTQGMNPAAGLAFLIAGPTTTLPAMVAVWQLASRRVFTLYVAFSLIGAILIGYIYQFVQVAW